MCSKIKLNTSVTAWLLAEYAWLTTKCFTIYLICANYHSIKTVCSTYIYYKKLWKWDITSIQHFPSLAEHLTEPPDIPWSPHIRYLGLELDSKLLFKKHLNTVTHKATGVLLKIFPLLARDSTLSSYNKLTLYKLLIRPILTYAAPVWSNTSVFQLSSSSRSSI